MSEHGVIEPDASWHLVTDPSLVLTDGDRVLIGGSPLRILRFCEPVDLATTRSPAVVDALVDAGMAHIEPNECDPDLSRVSIVVPVFDDPHALAATLRALSETCAGVARVFVVDDGSGPRDAIEAVTRHAPGLVVEYLRHEINLGPAAARNTGLRAVTTPFVAFVDAGCVPTAGWLSELLGRFVDPRVALVAPRVQADPTRLVVDATKKPTNPGTVSRLIGRYERVRSSLDQGSLPARVAPRSRVSYVPGACIVARVDELRRVRGFDESLRVGEDVDLVWRLAGTHRVRYVPTARIGHDVRGTPSTWLRRKFIYGTSAAPLARRHPRTLHPVEISPWSAAAWGALALGHPVTAALLASGSTAALAKKLSNLDHPIGVAVRLGGLGNLAAGRLIANALRREWWPLAVVGMAIGPRALRRSLLFAYTIAPLIEWRRASGLDPLTWVVLHLADDLAYGIGVVVGCAREGITSPLHPDLTAGRFARQR